MSNATNSIAEQIADQASRAFSANRPLFLVVIYQHENNKLDLVRELRKTIRTQDLMVESFDPAQRDEHDKTKLYELISAASKDQTLSLIVNLPYDDTQPKLDDSFLHFLNIHRDRIAREKLRIVLFLHQAGSEQFMLSAGDLWDFRQQTYWLDTEQTASDSCGLWQSLAFLPEIATNSQEEQEAFSAHIEKTEELVAQTADTEEKARLLLDLGRWLQRRHAWQTSAQVFRVAQQHISNRSTALLASLEHELGYSLQSESLDSEALTHYRKSLVLNREIDNKQGEGVTLNNIASIYKAWGKYDLALQTLQEGLAIRREVDDKAGEGVTLNNIAQIYDARGQYDQALQTLQESLAIRREAGDKQGEGVTLNNIAHIYLIWEKYDQALKIMEESLVIRREVGDKQGEGVTLNNIAHIYHAWGQYDQALKTLEESLAICREVGDKPSEGAVLNNIASIHTIWGKYDQALKTMEESLAISREIGDKQGEGVTCWNLALEWERREQFVKAVELASRCVAIKEETNNPDLEKSKSYLQQLQDKLAQAQN
jgi:tetratricopeptide (TPR) repeat protein